MKIKQNHLGDKLKVFEPTRDTLTKNDNIIVKKSNIHGYGVFAKNNIKKGEILEECHLIDVNIPSHPYVFMYPKNIQPINNVISVIPSGYGFIYNSSLNAFKANATWITKDEMITFVSIRDIKKNQEILIEYSHLLTGRDYIQKEIDYIIEMDKFAESIMKKNERINIMYELVLNDDVVDRAPLANLEQAKIFFVKRKQMTESQFDELGYSVRLVEPRRK